MYWSFAVIKGKQFYVLIWLMFETELHNGIPDLTVCIRGLAWHTQCRRHKESRYIAEHRLTSTGWP